MAKKKGKQNKRPGMGGQSQPQQGQQQKKQGGKKKSNKPKQNQQQTQQGGGPAKPVVRQSPAAQQLQQQQAAAPRQSPSAVFQQQQQQQQQQPPQQRVQQQQQQQQPPPGLRTQQQPPPQQQQQAYARQQQQQRGGPRNYAAGHGPPPAQQQQQRQQAQPMQRQQGQAPMQQRQQGQPMVAQQQQQQRPMQGQPMRPQGQYVQGQVPAQGRPMQQQRQPMPQQQRQPMPQQGQPMQRQPVQGQPVQQQQMQQRQQPVQQQPQQPQQAGRPGLMQNAQPGLVPQSPVASSPAASEHSFATSELRAALPNVSTPPRSEAASEEKLVASAIHHGAAGRLMVPYARNPPPGTLGRPIQVVSNMYQADISVRYMYAYKMEVFDQNNVPVQENHTTLRKTIYFRCKKDMEATFGMVFFDNTQLRAFVKGDEGREYVFEAAPTPSTREKKGRAGGKIVLRFTQAVDLTTEQGYELRNQYLHILLKSVANSTGMLRVGRSYMEDDLFEPRQHKEEIEFDGLRVGRQAMFYDRMAVHRGFQLSIENVINGLFMLKADIVHFLIHQQSCADIFEAAYNSARDNPSYWKMVEGELNNSVVMTIYNPRQRYRVTGINWDMSPTDTFDRGDGTAISFADYLFTRYGKTVVQDYPGMIVTTSRRRMPDGSKIEEDIYLCPEMCRRTGMAGKMGDDFMLRKKVLAKTTVAPRERGQLTDGLVKKLNDNMENTRRTNPTKAIPMKFHANGTVLQAKELPPPILRVQKNRVNGNPIRANSKGFGRDVQDSCFVNERYSGVLKDWYVVFEPEAKGDFDSAIMPIMRAQARMHRMVFHEPKAFPLGRGARPTDWHQALGELMSGNVSGGKKPDLVMCVLPFRGGDVIYHMISERGSHFGVVTQCVTSKNCRPGNRLRAIFAGLVRQMLAKVGNPPWIVDCNMGQHKNLLKHTKAQPARTMLVGLDVNHDLRHNDSTVGFASTYGDSSNYLCQHRFQERQKESLSDPGGLMLKALDYYNEKSGFFPTNIVIFRDGVSDSQFEMVINNEVRAYKAAIARIKQQYPKQTAQWAPKMTVVIVQKRVSVKFLTRDHCSVNAGTVVDSGVISDGVWNFYLHPCPPNKAGHVVPTRFVVLLDEVKFSQNDMQALCYGLCFAYPNWAGPIRVPAPAMMAHGIAYKYGSGRTQRMKTGGQRSMIPAITAVARGLDGHNHCL